MKGSDKVPTIKVKTSLRAGGVLRDVWEGLKVTFGKTGELLKATWDWLW